MSLDALTRTGERRARTGSRRRIVIGFGVAARARVGDGGMIRLGGREFPLRTIPGDERVHQAPAVADVEEPHRVPDFVHGHGARDLVAAARTDVVIERDRTRIRADVGEATYLSLVGVAFDLH